MALTKPSVQAVHVIKVITTKRSDLGIIIYIVQTYDTVPHLVGVSTAQALHTMYSPMPSGLWLA